jgi:hypothetical protein
MIEAMVVVTPRLRSSFFEKHHKQAHGGPAKSSLTPLNKPLLFLPIPLQAMPAVQEPMIMDPR